MSIRNLLDGLIVTAVADLDTRPSYRWASQLRHRIARHDAEPAQ